MPRHTPRTIDAVRELLGGLAGDHNDPRFNIVRGGAGVVIPMMSDREDVVAAHCVVVSAGQAGDAEPARCVAVQLFLLTIKTKPGGHVASERKVIHGQYVCDRRRNAG